MEKQKVFKNPTKVNFCLFSHVEEPPEDKEGKDERLVVRLTHHGLHVVLPRFLVLLGLEAAVAEVSEDAALASSVGVAGSLRAGRGGGGAPVEQLGEGGGDVARGEVVVGGVLLLDVVVRVRRTAK